MRASRHRFAVHLSMTTGELCRPIPIGPNVSWASLRIPASAAAGAARRAAAAGAGGLAAADGHARRGVEELLQEGELPATARRLARLQAEDVAVLEREMLDVGDFAV